MFLGIPHKIEQTAEYRESCPLLPLKSNVRRNSAGTSELRLEVRNQSKKTVDAFRFDTQCFDNYDKRIIDRNVIREVRMMGKTFDMLVKEALAKNVPGAHRLGDFAGSSDKTISPGQRSNVGYWSMFGHDGCTQAITTIHSVHFTDNTTWEGEVTQEFDPR